MDRAYLDSEAPEGTANSLVVYQIIRFLFGTPNIWAWTDGTIPAKMIGFDRHSGAVDGCGSRGSVLDCFASGWCRTLKCLGSRLPKPRLVLWLSQPAVWDSVPFSLFALLPFPNSNPLRFDQMVQISISRPRRCLWCSFPLFYFLQCLHYKIHGPTHRF